MKPAPFDYYAPASVAETVALLQQHGNEAKLLAGGQSLVPLLNMRLARPGVVVDINRVEELKYIRADGDSLAIGAMTNQRSAEQSELVRERNPLLYAAIRLIGHPQIRNRGTIGGSIAHADPAAELPALVVVLDAEMRIAGPHGERTVAARDFFVTYLTTALAEGELLTEVRFPSLPAGAGWSIQEMTRRHGDFALAGAIATLTLSGDTISEARIALFGVGATPVRLPDAEARLAGARLEQALLAEVGRAVSTSIDEPLTDIHATAEYRRNLAGVLTERALIEAAARAA